MVERFEVILFILFAPNFVEIFLNFAPLFVLGAQSPENEGHGHDRISLQALDDVGRLVAVNAPDCPLKENKNSPLPTDLKGKNYFLH